LSFLLFEKAKQLLALKGLPIEILLTPIVSQEFLSPHIHVPLGKCLFSEDYLTVFI